MTTKTIHNFHESLKKGQISEKLWLDLMTKNHPEYKIEHCDGRSHDFILHSIFGKFTIELKSDTYDMEKTENVFIERWSDFEKKKVGGPYQAQSKGIDLYCYWFVKNKIMLTFNVNKLIIKLDSMNLKDSKLIPIINRGFITKGWKIPRKDLEDVTTIHNFNI